MRAKNKNQFKSLSCLAILLFCEWFFFRNVIGTTALFGDDGDGRLTMLITEHWFHVLKGEADIAELGFYYPIRHTLAFSDMFLGFGIIHSLYRLLGMNVWFAYKWTLITVHALGTASCFYLLRRTLKTDHFWALLGTMAFSFSNAYATLIGHTQLVAISLLPLVAVFAIGFFRSIGKRKQRNIYAYLTIALLVGIMYTAWYIAFFSALFAVIVLVVWIIVMAANGRSPIRAVSGFIKTVRFDLFGYIIAFIALCAPFIYLELEVVGRYGGRDYWDITPFLPEFIDIINVTGNNWAMGGAMQALALDSRNIVSGEVSTGFSLVLLSLFIGLTVSTILRKGRATGKNEHFYLMLCEIISFAVIANILLPIRLSGNGLSLWQLVFAFFPGGSSIRAMGRVFLFLSFPMAVVTAVMGNHLSKHKSVNKKRPLIRCALLLLVFVFNIRTEGAYSRYDAQAAFESLSAVSPPPGDCEVFYIVNGDDAHKKSEAYAQLDAHEIADHFNLYTINGYTGVIPDDYKGIFYLNDSGYESAVAKWIIDHRLENVYCYNVAKNSWTEFDVLQIADSRFCAADKKIPDMIYGLWDMNPTGDFSWTKQEFEVTLRDESITKNGLLLKAGTANPNVYLKQEPEGSLDYSIYVNGELIETLQATGEYNEYRFDVPAAKDDLYDIEIKSNFYFNPKELGISEDNRDLSLALYYLGAAD